MALSESLQGVHSQLDFPCGQSGGSRDKEQLSMAPCLAGGRGHGSACAGLGQGCSKGRDDVHRENGVINTHRKRGDVHTQKKG